MCLQKCVCITIWKSKTVKMVSSSLRHVHLGKFQINCDSAVSSSGVFMCTIDVNYSVLYATMAVLGENWGVYVVLK